MTKISVRRYLICLACLKSTGSVFFDLQIEELYGFFLLLTQNFDLFTLDSQPKMNSKQFEIRFLNFFFTLLFKMLFRPARLVYRADSGGSFRHIKVSTARSKLNSQRVLAAESILVLPFRPQVTLPRSHWENGARQRPNVYFIVQLRS